MRNFTVALGWEPLDFGGTAVGEIDEDVGVFETAGPNSAVLKCRCIGGPQRLCEFGKPRTRHSALDAGWAWDVAILQTIVPEVCNERSILLVSTNWHRNLTT